MRRQPEDVPSHRRQSLPLFLGSQLPNVGLPGLEAKRQITLLWSPLRAALRVRRKRGRGLGATVPGDGIFRLRRDTTLKPEPSRPARAAGKAWPRTRAATP